MPGMNILLAEDNRDHRELLLLALTLGAPNNTVITAASRDEVVAAAEHHEFDCVILDFNLPPYSAPEIVEDLQRILPEVPIVVISASERQSIVIDSLRTGVADFVPKFTAIKGDELLTRVRAAVAEADSTRNERREQNRRIVELRREADTDILTGLATRRYAERYIENTGFRSDRRENTAVVMLDLDKFKQVNDRFGHAAGDEVLKQAGQLIRERTAATDLATRWGGEEIMVLLQSATMAEAWLWAEQLRIAIKNSIAVDNGPEQITVSIGIDAIPIAQLSSVSMTRADQALYLAKESGRDRVGTWPMVEVLEAAYLLQSDPSISPRERIRALIRNLEPGLSETQREHLGQHSEDVVELTRTVAARIGLDTETEADLLLAAEFHDIGKVAIPDRFLAQPRPLNLEEKLIVDDHARFGSQIFQACGASQRSASFVEHHHLRYEDMAQNQNGSPAGIDPVSILTACDALITMLSDRPYANRRFRGDAFEELDACSGTQFDPEVVRCLRSIELSQTRTRLAA